LYTIIQHSSKFVTYTHLQKDYNNAMHARA